jgi:catechol 2,3-dioxygenase-like lactoylglutathione lyase family enzyme
MVWSSQSLVPAEEVEMLDQFPAHTTIAVADLERAKAWYADKLDLKPTEEDPGGAWYEYAGATFLLFSTQFAGTAKNTVMEWTVDDVDKVATELKGRGITFDTFEMEGITWEGDVASMGDHKAAWFKDSEGNILAITS